MLPSWRSLKFRPFVKSYSVKNIVAKGENAGFHKVSFSVSWSLHHTILTFNDEHFLLYPRCYKFSFSHSFFLLIWRAFYHFNRLSDTPILGFSNSAPNKDPMSKIWTNGDTTIWLGRKYCGKRRNCSLRAISSFPTVFSKAICCWCVKTSIRGVNS